MFTVLLALIDASSEIAFHDLYFGTFIIDMCAIGTLNKIIDNL